MGPEKEATACFSCQGVWLRQILANSSCIRRTKVLHKKKKSSSSGNIFWFQKGKGMTREDFVFILSSILLRITEYFVLQGIHKDQVQLLSEWSLQGSNTWPWHYSHHTLTNWATQGILLLKKLEDKFIPFRGLPSSREIAYCSWEWHEKPVIGL